MDFRQPSTSVKKRTSVESAESGRLIGAVIPDPEVFTRVQAVAQLANVQVVSLLDLGEHLFDSNAQIFGHDLHSSTANSHLVGQKPHLLGKDSYSLSRKESSPKPKCSQLDSSSLSFAPPHSALEILRRCELLVIAVGVPLSDHLSTLCQAPKVLVGPGADIQLPGDEVVLARLLQTQTKASPEFRGLVLVARWNNADSWSFAHQFAALSRAVLVDCAPEFAEWLAPPNALTWADLTPRDLPDGRTLLQTLPKAGSVPCLTNAATKAINPADSRVADLALRLPRHQVIHCGQLGAAALNLCQEFYERANLEFPILLLGRANTQKITSFARTMQAIRENCGITPTPVVLGAVGREFRSLCASEKIRFFQLRTLSRRNQVNKQLQAIWQHIKT